MKRTNLKYLEDKADVIVVTFYFYSVLIVMVLFAASFVFIFSSSHENTFGDSLGLAS